MQPIPSGQLESKCGSLPFRAVTDKIVLCERWIQDPIPYKGKNYTFSVQIVLRQDFSWHVERPCVQGPLKADKVSESLVKEIQEIIQKRWNLFIKSIRGTLFLRKQQAWWQLQIRNGILAELEKKFADLQILQDEIRNLVKAL